MKERARDVGSRNKTDKAADRLSNMPIDSNEFDKKAKPHPGRHYSSRWRHHTNDDIQLDSAICLDSCHVRPPVIHIRRVH
jgi:hypothetical protein